MKRKTWFVLAVLVVGTLGLAALVAPSAQARLNCKGVSCAAPACEDYEHLQVPPGQCCPICVHN
jgi:hypothetical protein